MAGRFSGGTGWTRCALTALLLGAGGWTAPALAQSDLSTQFSPATDPTLLNEAGWASIAARNYDKAKSDFEAAIAADPQMLDARRGLARAYAGLEDMDSAMRIIEPLRTVSPVFQLELAALLLIAEQPERALSEIDRAVAWAQERAARQDGARIARQFEKRATMLRGEALYLLGGYEAAMEQFEAAHRILPSASSWRAIGDTYLAQGDRTNAMTAYSEALRLRRYDGLAYRRRARVRFLEGDYEGAIGDYREAQVSLDESRDLLAEFSEALLAAEAYGDAVTVLNRLLPHTRGDEEAERTVRYHLASAMIEAGRLRDAEQQIASIGTWKGKEVPLLFLRGRAKIGLGDYATAYRIFSAALEQRRGDPQLLYNRGLASLRLNNVERALDDLAEASVRAPQNSQIRDAIGQIKLFQGKFDEGIAFYNAGVAAHKDDPAPLVQRARALLTIGQAQRALEDASRALELDPDSTDAAGAAAMAYLQLGDPVASRAYSDRLVASRTRKREGYILRARASIAEGLPNDGLSAIEQARNFGAPETQLALLEGDAHAAMDAYEDAAVAYERAIMLNPSLTQARVRHGDAMVQINRLDEAADDYRAALAAVPGSLSLRMKHAEALRQGGRCQDAIEQYDMVLTMAPEHAQALRGRGKCRISEGPFFAGLSDMISSFF